MATGELKLWLAAGLPPDGSTDNAAPAVQVIKSSAAAPTPYIEQAAFDDTVEEFLMWQFEMPLDYASAPVITVQFKALSATSGTFGLLVYVMAVTPGDTQDVDADAYAASNTITAVTVPAVAGRLEQISGTLTNLDGLAAGDMVLLRVGRNVAVDTAAGDIEVTTITLTYTTT